MNLSNPKLHNSPRHGQEPNRASYLFFGAMAVASIVLTFLLAASDVIQTFKFAGLAAVIFAYVIICNAAYRHNERGQRHKSGAATEPDNAIEDFPEDVRDKLSSLEDANDFFGSSLKPADMFRLVFSRVSEIVPVSTCVLFVPNHDQSKWIAEYVEGQKSQFLQSLEFDAGDGLAGIAAVGESIIVDHFLIHDADLLPDEFLQGFRSAVSLPLVKDGAVFAVFQIYSDKPVNPGTPAAIYESLAERLAPIFVSSLAFERSLSNALSDPLTKLPNERAFFMILENQLAESQRYRDERPLTVLTIDIKGFADINLKYGHATGDRILNFAAKTMRGQLRKMDFLARSVNDEFIAILPNAPEKTADEIIERLKAGFTNDPFKISDDETFKIWLNFGSATFWQDGETAQQLLQNAQVRKQQAKSQEPSKVLWFPKEYVN